jgi:ATP-dependent exoDNAse (exonuclease V) alpha subunit
VIELTQAVDFDDIDLSQVDIEDGGAFSIETEFLARPRTGVQFMPVIEGDEIVDGCASPPRPATIKAAVTAYQELIAIHGPENVIVVAPFKDKPAGVKELNDAIRVSLGSGPPPCAGDFLMITKNSFDRDRLNGERYRAVAVDVDRKFIKARLIGTRHEIIIDLVKPRDKGPCKDVDWGYAATVHKFQGSEAAATIVVIPSGTLKLMKAVGGEKEPWFADRSFAYTACSRPKLSLVLIGDPKDICGAIKMNRSDRVTALSRMFHSGPEPEGAASALRAA